MSQRSEVCERNNGNVCQQTHEMKTQRIRVKVWEIKNKTQQDGCNMMGKENEATRISCKSDLKNWQMKSTSSTNNVGSVSTTALIFIQQSWELHIILHVMCRISGWTHIDQQWWCLKSNMDSTNKNGDSTSKKGVVVCIINADIFTQQLIGTSTRLQWVPSCNNSALV